MSNNGADITKFKIEILTSDGETYIEDLVDCDGTDETIFANNYCLIPMTTFLDELYSLT
jgi:hypothetical protein